MAEAIITTPDGRKLKITGPSKQALEAYLPQVFAQLKPSNDIPRLDPSGEVVFDDAGGSGLPMPKDRPSGLSVLGNLTGERMLDNALGIPNMLARAGGGLRNVGRAAIGQDMQQLPNTSYFPQIPSGREALAGIKGILGPGFDASKQSLDQMEADNPGTAMAAGLLGDAATIATGRAPMVRGPGGLLDAPIQGGIESAVKWLGSTNKTTGTRRALERIGSHETFQDLARAAGRATETGIEAAALTTLQGGDPVEVAAFAAGGQMATSLALWGAQHTAEAPLHMLGTEKPYTLSKKVFGTLVAASVLGNFAQIVKSVAPGGKDWLRESQEFGFDKVAFNLMLGATLGLAGKRTKADGVLAQYPRIADAIAALPRTAMIKGAQQLAADPELERVIQLMASDPMAFGQKTYDRLSNAIYEGTFAETYKQAIEDDPELIKLMDSPDPRLSGVPVKEDK